MIGFHLKVIAQGDTHPVLLWLLVDDRGGHCSFQVLERKLLVPKYLP